MNVVSNEDVAIASFITFQGDNIEEYKKQDIVTNIWFEAIVHSIKRYLFHNSMVDFVNKLEVSGQKYQTNGNIRDEKYNGNFLFPIKYFLSFDTDCPSMYFMSTIFLKEKVNGVCVTQFQFAHIRDTTHPPNKTWAKLCRELNNMWWENQYLELQEWED